MSDGRVHCPRVGHDVTVETCWMCEHLLDFDVGDKTEIVHCSPERWPSESIPAM